MISTLIDYVAARQMEKQDTKQGRKKYLILSLITNLGLLVAFKYFNFLSDATHQTFAAFNIFYDAPMFDLLLPVGISFYTFQTLSYTIDVYRGERPAEKHLGYFALYVSFFPQLVAGPIERSTRLLPQFFQEKKYEAARVASGLRQMLFGLFKKVVIADRLAVYVDNVYASPDDFGSLTILIATYFFAFQIYCDFSGYSDIAIGAAKVLGYDLMENFRRPYIAKSISDFWKRWHISLSTWFRDYLYIPLGGNKSSKIRWQYNVLVVFVVSGFWHGANWTFLVWGGLHGVYLLIGSATANLRYKFWGMLPFASDGKVKRIIQRVLTFHLVLFAWIFFRAASLTDAGHIINRILSLDLSSGLSGLSAGFASVNSSAGPFMFITVILAIILMEFVQTINLNEVERVSDSVSANWKRWSLDYALIIILLLFGVFGHSEFIYFQF